MTHPQINTQVSAANASILKLLKNEKHEFIEVKHVKFEKQEVKELKDHSKVEFEVPFDVGPIVGPDPVTKAALLQQAEALEAAGKQLRHFIAQSERPDLTEGALRNEPDAAASQSD